MRYNIKTDTEKEPPIKKMNVLYNRISLYCFEQIGSVNIKYSSKTKGIKIIIKFQFNQYDIVQNASYKSQFYRSNLS